MLGPLLGYGFLPGRPGTGGRPGSQGRAVLGLAARAWVGVGPWVGFLGAIALGWVAYGVLRLIASLRARPASRARAGPDFWATRAGQMILAAGCAAWRTAGCRGGRRDPPRRPLGPGTGAALGRGLSAAALFVGSLFGSYWVVTVLWRSYYFDPTIVGLRRRARRALVWMAGVPGRRSPPGRCAGARLFRFDAPGLGPGAGPWPGGGGARAAEAAGPMSRGRGAAGPPGPRASGSGL
jgi:hypothetical protein